MERLRRTDRTGRWPVATFFAVAVMIAAAGWWLGGVQDRAELDARYQELTAIGRSKARQIEAWREERIGGARVLAEWPAFAPAVERWQASRSDAALRDTVYAHLRIMRERLGYADAAIFAPDGTLLMAGTGEDPDVDSSVAGLVVRAVRTRQVVFGDFYRCTVCRRIHIDVLAPLAASDGRVVGALLLRSDPFRSLYPMLASWPTRGATAETLLVRREGDSVVMLNELRTIKGAALNLRRSLSETTLPAANAVAGQVGRFEGVDYAGNAVLADLRPVAGSGWYIIAKINLGEALAEAKVRRWMTLGLATLGILFVAAAIGYLTRRQQRDTYRSLYETESALRETQARDRWLSSMLEQSVNEVYAFDATTLRFEYVSRSALSRLGYTLDEMRAMTPLDIKPNVSQEQFQALIAPLRAGEQAIVEFETVHRAKDGTQYDVLLVLQMVDAPSGRQFLAMGLDVTNRKRLEAQLLQGQRMEAVGRLAGGIAHDFNNLLSVIINYAEFGEEGAAPGEPSREYFAEIRAAGERAALLTRQLLAFGRKQVLQLEVLSPNDVVRGLEGMLGRLIGEHITLAAELSPGLRNVKADRGQLEQVLVNLAVNARDAMPDGGVLTIETANADLDEGYAATHVDVVPGPYVLLSVSDTGHGMDEETRRRAFDPFFTTKPAGKGTGLGLSTVYGIVRQSGGNVWVYSEPGKGTAFKVYLPAAGDAAPAAAATDARGSVAAARAHETVLLVEDEPGVRELARRILEMAGYDVIAASGPSEAQDAAAAGDRPIALLVTDVVMPQMSGPHLAELLQRSRPALRVLYMSGYTENSIVHHGVLDEGTEFIAKPFTMAGLTRKVREVLDKGARPAPM